MKIIVIQTDEATAIDAQIYYLNSDSDGFEIES